MKPLTTIPLPTKAAPKPTAVRTTRAGLGWRPNAGTTKKANVELFHAKQFNLVAGPLSILTTYPREED